MTIEFIITSLIIILVPGTGVIYTVSSGLTQNRKAAFIAAIGCTLGIVPHLIAGILGLSVLMHTSALIFKIIRYAGVAYLTYMGIGMLRNKGGISIDESMKDINHIAIIRRGILINLLNPKLTLFFLSFLPQFINEGSNYQASMIMMSLVFMLMTLMVFMLYGLIASYFKHFITSSERAQIWLHRCFGSALLVFAAKLAVSED